MQPLTRLACLFGVVSLIGAYAGTSATSSGADSTEPQAMFVIGDLSAALGAPVTFWGAQWWKRNTLSTASVPPSFKGYALNVAPNCGGFTTVTGNSAPPPPGPLPATIDVLVANNVQQNGNIVTGTVTNIAVVQTDPGYDSNPGHAGTGTVTGFLGCGGE